MSGENKDTNDNVSENAVSKKERRTRTRMRKKTKDGGGR